MAGRGVLAACLLLTSAVATPFAQAQRGIVPPTTPLPAPKISPPPRFDAPASASPALVAPMAAAKPDVAASADNSAAYSSTGGESGLPQTPSYSDLCQVAPRPPWCSDSPAPAVKK
jgi:hypothetical protein